MVKVIELPSLTEVVLKTLHFICMVILILTNLASRLHTRAAFNVVAAT